MNLIAIDGNEANVEKKVGVSIYTLSLLSYFQKKANSETQFVVFLKHKPRPELPQENEYFSYRVIQAPFAWSQIFLPFYLFKEYVLGKRYSVFFSPAHYAPRFLPCKSVVTIHDVSYLLFPHEFLKKDLYQLKQWTNYSVKRANKIIAVSKTTKKDLMRWYKISENKIQVIYNGFEKLSFADNLQKEEELKKENPYILYVGTIQPRKNLETLIEAFSKLQTRHPEFRLVIVGKKGWLSDQIYKKVKQLNLDLFIHFTGYIPENVLISYYKNAFCFVLPSLYEGFGIPILESMSFGCPVVSSFTSSLPEIGGDACLYFDPTDSNELVDRIEELINDKNLRKQLIHKGKKRVNQFSWNRCAEETLQILTTV